MTPTPGDPYPMGAVDLAGTHGLSAGVAFAYPLLGGPAPDGRPAMAGLATGVVARSTDGKALGGSSVDRWEPVADLAARVRDALAAGPGHPHSHPHRFLSGLGSAERLFEQDMGDMAHALAAATGSSTETARGLIAGTRRLVRGFLDGLDQGARHFVRRPDVRDMLNDLGWGFWEALDPSFGHGAPLGRAVAAEPGLARALVMHWRDDPVRFASLPADAAAAEAAVSHGLVEACDLPLLGSCLRMTADTEVDLSPSVLFGTLRSTDRATALVRCAAPFPPNWHPRATEGWQAFARCSAAAQWATFASPGAPGRVLGGGGDWARLADRLESLAGPRGLAVAVSNIDDMARALARQVLVPAFAMAGTAMPVAFDDRGMGDDARDGGDDMAMAVLGSGRGMARILDLSARWHAADAGISARLAALPGRGGLRLGWPTAYPDLSLDGLEATELTDEAALADEGRAGPDAAGMEGLAHCVGGYATRCRRGTSRIVAIRAVDADGRRIRLSTAELVLGRDGIQARQHLGTANLRPPPEAEAFLARYLDLVDSRGPAMDVGNLAPLPDTDPRLAAGYDFGMPGNWEEARDAWAPLLPRPARALAAAALATAVSAFAAANAGPWSTDAFGQGAWRAAGAARG